MRSLVLALAALLLAGCASPEEAPAAPAAGESSGPAWAFEATDGATYSRDAPEGNATVLFFMATWCGSCRTKAPVLADAHEAFSESGVRFSSLDFDPSETREDLRAWQERYRQPWPHGIDEGRALQRTFDVRSQSSVVVLDGGGRVVEHFGYGSVTSDALADAVERALA